MRLAPALVLFALGAGALAGPAAAQVTPAQRPAPPRPAAASPFRGFATINGGYLTASKDFTDRTTTRVNAEDGTQAADYEVRGGPSLDLAGGVTVWRQLAVGAGVTRYATSTPLAVSAAVPHPFFFNRPRTVTGDVGGLERQELAVHVQARAQLPLRGALQASVFGGPSFFRVTQGVLTAAAYEEAYPYDVAALGPPATVRARASRVGLNVGGDVAYFFTRRVGVGVSAQLTRATLDMPIGEGRTAEVAAGGLQTGAGLRLRF